MSIATTAHWRTLHSHVVDAILAQPHKENIEALVLLVGLTSLGFIDAVESGRARIRSALKDGHVRYVVEVKADDGYVPLTCPTAEALGLPGHVDEDEVAFLAEQLVEDVERMLGEDKP